VTEPASTSEVPRRIVAQPTKPRHRLLPDAPTFQAYVDAADRYRNPRTSSYLSIDYLRDEYISTWGDN
jgi:hypothetical protein